MIWPFCGTGCQSFGVSTSVNGWAWASPASKLRVTGIGFNQITQFFAHGAGITKLQNDVTYNADFVKLQVRKSRLVQDIISWIMYDTWGFVEV